MTVSTRRYNKRAEGQDAKDESGEVASKLIENHKHSISKRDLVSDDSDSIRTVTKGFLASGDDLLVLMGGTGMSTTDVTIESVRPFFEKELEGFGEIFRARSFRRIGAAAALTRATAGVSRGKVILCLPGSPDGVRTALGLFIDEIPHIVQVARS